MRRKEALVDQALGPIDLRERAASSPEERS